jgi:molybdenum cofactor sulfurtransferase
MPAIESGLKFIESIGIDVIHERVICLTDWLIDQLTGLRHSNGAPLLRLYGPPNTQMRGGTIQVNFFAPDGDLIDCTIVERMANDVRISLRAGCHCNPGAREVALDFSEDELVTCFRDKDSQSYEPRLASSRRSPMSIPTCSSPGRSSTGPQRANWVLPPAVIGQSRAMA